MSKILTFPYERIRVEVEVHQAKILKLPVREIDPLLAFALFWFTAFLPPLR